MNRFLVGCLCLLVSASPTAAADKAGRFMMGGGTGSVHCPDFLNSLAMARQDGGLNSLAGAQRMQGYLMFVSGFQTAYNMQTPGVLDIFGSLGDQPIERAIYAVEPWCQRNPDKLFGAAVVDLAEQLQSRHPK